MGKKGFGKKVKDRYDKGRKKENEKEDLKRRKENHIPLIVLFSFVLLLSVLAYLRALKGPLVFDDIIYIRPVKLGSILSHISLHVRSVAELSFALNYALSGMNIAVFRATNIVFHILASFAVFYLTYVTLTLPSVKNKYEESDDERTPLYVALFAATMFLLHPIQTSAVDYITQRMAIMAAMFSFAGLILYVKGAANAGRRSFLCFAISVLAFGLAIFSKENAVMVLPMLMIYDFVFMSAFKWSEFKKRFIPIAALVMILGLVVAYYFKIGGFVGKVVTLFLNPHQPLGSYGWTGVDINWTPIEYVLTELRVVSRYVFLILVPAPSFMAFDYSNAYPVSKDLLDPITTLGSLLFLALGLVFSLRYLKKAPLISFGIIWYLITISLESVIAIGLDPYFEHRNYLPSYGLFLAIASLLAYAGKLKRSVRKEVIISVVAVLLSVLTFVRNGVWRTDELLWKDALDKSPNNARALVNLSYGCIKEKRFQEAEEYLRRAGNVQPITNSFRVDVLINQAALYKETGRRQAALAVLKKLEADSSLPENRRSYIQFLMGDFLRMEGDLPGAKTHLEAAYRDEKLRRDSSVLPVTLAFVSRALGETDKAEEYFHEAVRIDPTATTPYMELGDLYLVKKDLEKAEANYRVIVGRGMRGDMGRRALFGLAQIAFMRDETDKAEGLFEQVVKIAPGFYPSYIFLGGIYVKKNDPDRALSYLEKALSLKEAFIKDEPNTKLLFFYLGRVYLMKGEERMAKKNFDIFLLTASGDKRLAEHYVQARRERASIR